ncbi:hypothetical protein F383_18869 [Gossypium arboreum]|nr:hypothetical protein F383_18869 [Gossypium arboreum]
MIMNWH